MKSEMNRSSYLLLIAVFAAMIIAAVVGANMNLWGATASTLQGVQQNALTEAYVWMDSAIANMQASAETEEPAA